MSTVNAAQINPSNGCHWKPVAQYAALITGIAITILSSVALAYPATFGIPTAACYASFGLVGAFILGGCLLSGQRGRIAAAEVSEAVPAGVAAEHARPPQTLRSCLQDALRLTSNDWDQATSQLLRRATLLNEGQTNRDFPNPDCHAHLIIAPGVVLTDETYDDLSEPGHPCQPVTVARALRGTRTNIDPTQIRGFNEIVTQLRRRYETELNARYKMDELVFEDIRNTLREEFQTPETRQDAFENDPNVRERLARLVTLRFIRRAELVPNHPNCLSFPYKIPSQWYERYEYTTFSFAEGAPATQLHYFVPGKTVTTEPLQILQFAHNQGSKTEFLNLLEDVIKDPNTGTLDEEYSMPRECTISPFVDLLGPLSDQNFASAFNAVATCIQEKFLEPYLHKKQIQTTVAQHQSLTRLVDEYFRRHILFSITGFMHPGYNCFYRAIIASMNPFERLSWGITDLVRIHNLRSAIANYIEQNNDPEAIIEYHVGNYTTIEYAQNVRQGQIMTGSREIAALAAILNRPIHYYNEDDNTAPFRIGENNLPLAGRVFNANGSGSILYLHLQGAHYDSLSPRWIRP